MKAPQGSGRRLTDAWQTGLLSNQEQEIVRLAAQGRTEQEIAQRLNLSEPRMGSAKARLFNKLGITTPVELILYALCDFDRDLQQRKRISSTETKGDSHKLRARRMAS